MEENKKFYKDKECALFYSKPTFEWYGVTLLRDTFDEEKGFIGSYFGKK
jgi:hypothetical protein